KLLGFILRDGVAPLVRGRVGFHDTQLLVHVPADAGPRVTGGAAYLNKGFESGFLLVVQCIFFPFKKLVKTRRREKGTFKSTNGFPEVFVAHRIRVVRERLLEKLLVLLVLSDS